MSVQSGRLLERAAEMALTDAAAATIIPRIMLPSSSVFGVVGPLAAGGISACWAQLWVHPFELVKTSLQIQSASSRPPKAASFATTVCTVISEHGARGLWQGGTAACVRELTYCSMRLGLYKPFKRALGATDPRTTPWWKMVVAAGCAGATSACVLAPVDFVKVRMMGAPPPFQTLRWHIGDIFRRDGVPGFWRGVHLNMARAIVFSGTYLSTYDYSKLVMSSRFGQDSGTLSNLAGASFITGVAVVGTVAPVDYVRTRIFAPRHGPRCAASLLRDAIRTNGPFVLWRGAMPMYFFVGPYTLLQFTAWEALCRSLGTTTT